MKIKSPQESICTCSNISVNEPKQAEQKEFEKQLIKFQLDPMAHNKMSNDLEVALSKLRAERDEYLYEINCLKKQHNKEVLFTTNFFLNLIHSNFF